MGDLGGTGVAKRLLPDPICGAGPSSPPTVDELREEVDEGGPEGEGGE